MKTQPEIAKLWFWRIPLRPSKFVQMSRVTKTMKSTYPQALYHFHRYWNMHQVQQCRSLFHRNNLTCCIQINLLCALRWLVVHESLSIRWRSMQMRSQGQASRHWLTTIRKCFLSGDQHMSVRSTITCLWRTSRLRSNSPRPAGNQRDTASDLRTRTLAKTTSNKSNWEPWKECQVLDIQTLNLVVTVG